MQSLIQFPFYLILPSDSLYPPGITAPAMKKIQLLLQGNDRRRVSLSSPLSPSEGWASPVHTLEKTPETWSGPPFSPSTYSPLRKLHQSIFIYQVTHIQRPSGPFHLADPQRAQTLSKPNKSPSPLPCLPRSGPPPILPFSREHQHPVQSPMPQALASSAAPLHLSSYQVPDRLPPPQVYLSRPISLVSTEAHLSCMTPNTF